MESLNSVENYSQVLSNEKLFCQLTLVAANDRVHQGFNECPDKDLETP